MNAELKAKWIAALRSGEYKQGRDVLRKRDGDSFAFCCLGVLCDISGKGQWSDERSFEIAPEYADFDYSATLEGDLGAQGRVVFGVSDDFRLIQMNDTEKRAFAEIADYIEANL